MSATIRVLNLGQKDYVSVWKQMRTFTDQRDENTADEFWIVEHPAVFTLGQAGKPEHVLQPGDIPVVQSDRGGQVTFHGPGQLVVYLLLDLRRRKLGIKKLVGLIENAIVALLAEFDIQAQTRNNAPGVYVQDKKIAALGLRIRNGCSYHGLSLNVNMDLEPFTRINPCGFANLEVTQLADYIDQPGMDKVSNLLIAELQRELS